MERRRVSVFAAPRVPIFIQMTIQTLNITEKSQFVTLFFNYSSNKFKVKGAFELYFGLVAAPRMVFQIVTAFFPLCHGSNSVTSKCKGEQLASRLLPIGGVSVAALYENYDLCASRCRRGNAFISQLAVGC